MAYSFEKTLKYIIFENNNKLVNKGKEEHYEKNGAHGHVRRFSIVG